MKLPLRKNQEEKKMEHFVEREVMCETLNPIPQTLQPLKPEAGIHTGL